MAGLTIAATALIIALTVILLIIFIPIAGIIVAVAALPIVRLYIHCIIVPLGCASLSHMFLILLRVATISGCSHLHSRTHYY